MNKSDDDRDDDDDDEICNRYLFLFDS